LSKQANSVTLESICSINPPLGQAVSAETEITFLPMEHIAEGGGRLQSEIRRRDAIPSGLTAFRDEDVLIAKITPCFENQKGWLAHGLSSGVGFGSTELHVVRAGPRVLPRIVYAHTQSLRFRRLGERFMTGSAGQQRVSADFLRGYRIWLPNLAAQRRIASLDEQLEATLRSTDALIAAKREQKRGLMQQLLTGKVRFPGFTEPWKTVRLADVLSEDRTPGSTGASARKITVKLYGKGVIAKVEKRAGSESTRYFRRRAGQLIYSKLDCLNGAFGIIPEQLEGYESTLDMPAFDIRPSANPDWLLAVVSRPSFYTRFKDGADGSRKAQRVDPTRFLEELIQLPARHEQDRIAALLLCAEREIMLLASQRHAMAAQRRGLMERLLSGELDIPFSDTSAA
jgi:restriction endonuclease S subunit